MAFNWFKKKRAAVDEDAALDKEPTVPDPTEDIEPAVEDVQTDGPAPEREDPTDVAPVIEDRPPADENTDTVPLDAPPVPSTDETHPRKGLFGRLKSGLQKTRVLLNTDIEDLFAGGRALDEDMLEELEEMLITADVGVQTTMDLVAQIKKKGRFIKGPDDLKIALREEIRQRLPDHTEGMMSPSTTPHVIMVVGVNGVGKTTTIGKLAAKGAASGKKVLIAAADTFRAAAIEQLSIWADRAGADIVRHRENSDPAAVAYDAVKAAVAREVDIVLVDTAGRLHTKVNLMEEIKKIKRSMGKTLPGAPHDILLVLDATTGQNAVSQAKLFNEALEITGIALTKLDGTAKGGIVVSICDTLQIPLAYIGVGEGIDDLQPFDAEQFVDALI